MNHTANFNASLESEKYCKNPPCVLQVHEMFTQKFHYLVMYLLQHHIS